jgi:hypothetical protein
MPPSRSLEFVPLRSRAPGGGGGSGGDGGGAPLRRSLGRLAMGPRGAEDAPDRVKVVDGFRTQTSMTLHVLESLQLVAADASTAEAALAAVRFGAGGEHPAAPRCLLTCPLHADDFPLGDAAVKAVRHSALTQFDERGWTAQHVAPLLAPIAPTSQELSLAASRFFAALSDVDSQHALAPPRVRSNAYALPRSFQRGELSRMLDACVAQQSAAAVRIIKVDAAACVELHRTRQARPAMFASVVPDVEKWEVAAAWLGAIHRLYGREFLLPLARACGWEWAFHGSASAASPQRAHLHGRGRQQLLMRLATVGACQWLIGAVPPALLADMGGGLLRRLRGATGARMVVEFLLFSALPWWALRQALHDNDADQIGWTLAHACHQLRAADLPTHAQACALHLGIHRGAHREVQRVLRGLCCCPRRPIRPPSASLKHQQVLRDPSHGAPPPPRSSRSPPRQRPLRAVSPPRRGAPIATEAADAAGERRDRRGAPVSEAELLDLLDTPSEARFRQAPAEASGDGFARATAKVKAFLTKHLGSELPQLEHPTGRNPFTREILGQTPADRVAKVAAGEVPNAAPWREQVAEWLRLLEL